MSYGRNFFIQQHASHFLFLRTLFRSLGEVFPCLSQLIMVIQFRNGSTALLDPWDILSVFTKGKTVKTIILLPSIKAKKSPKNFVPVWWTEQRASVSYTRVRKRYRKYLNAKLKDSIEEETKAASDFDNTSHSDDQRRVKGLKLQIF